MIGCNREILDENLGGDCAVQRCLGLDVFIDDNELNRLSIPHLLMS